MTALQCYYYTIIQKYLFGHLYLKVKLNCIPQIVNTTLSLLMPLVCVLLYLTIKIYNLYNNLQ